MRICTPVFILLAVVLFGCASDHFRIGNGDVGQFILRQAITSGGSPNTTNNLPAINTQWSYSTDKNGMVIRMPREEYPFVKKFLFQAFGKPGLGPEGDGQLCVYRLTTTGGAIQFVNDTNETMVVIIHPLNESEIKSPEN
jgi:hypothetical protein